VLRDYYAHVNTFPDTLLTRFFGLHRVKPHGGRNVRFVVMGNLLCTGHAIHRRYDLKGSTYGRLTPSPYDAAKKILKDLDLDYTYQLDDGYAARLKAQLSADCVLLERLNIMDYSLLLGVHFQTKATRCAQQPARGCSQQKVQQRGSVCFPLPCVAMGARCHALTHHPAAPAASRSAAAAAAAAANGAADPGKQGRLAGKTLPEGDDDDDDDFTGVPNTHLGENMTALAIPGRVLPAPKGYVQPPLPTERVSVILNFGIIDILQEYNMSKQIEHSWKVRAPVARLLALVARSLTTGWCALAFFAACAQSIVQRQQNISSVDPTDYAARFKDFMNGIFS
jgi:1-phosphatidylinositol-4-phosphate 5-kinase